jgi:hypothetical protein
MKKNSDSEIDAMKIGDPLEKFEFTFPDAEFLPELSDGFVNCYYVDSPGRTGSRLFYFFEGKLYKIGMRYEKPHKKNSAEKHKI